MLEWLQRPLSVRSAGELAGTDHSVFWGDDARPVSPASIASDSDGAVLAAYIGRRSDNPIWSLYQLRVVVVVDPVTLESLSREPGSHTCETREDLGRHQLLQPGDFLLGTHGNRYPSL